VLAAFFLGVALKRAYDVACAVNLTESKRLEAELKDSTGFTPAILRKLLGDYFLVDIVGVYGSNLRGDAGSVLTDELVARFGRLGTVRSLFFWRCALAESDFARLANLTTLERLGVNMSNVTDRHLLRLRPLARLRELSLENSEITNDGLKSLRELRQLRYVHVSGSNVNDMSVDELRELTWLQELDVDGPQFSVDARRALQSALPNCVIKEPFSYECGGTFD
jgi:hypothetical protein